MTIEDYIKRYGDVPFLIKPFNEVDNVILSLISYLDFDGILDVNESLTLKEAAKLFFKRYNKLEIKTSFYSIKNAIETFDLIKDTIRYSDLRLYNYVYKRDYYEQFSALFIDLTDKLTYISFEGTDELISGWGEDAALSYSFPVPAQKDAIDYVNKRIPIFDNRKYILGGHSKGGNLALVAGMYAKFSIRRKIIKIYSNDGPGLRLKEFKSIRYKRIEHKYHLIVPKYSIVGMFLHPKVDKIVVDTTIRGPLTHCVKFWRVKNDHFKRSEITPFSKKLDETITTWLESYNDLERKEFINNILEIFRKCHIESLLDIKEAKLKSAIKILRESKKLDKKSKGILVALFTTSIDSIIKRGN